MSNRINLARTIALLATFTAGCADTPSITGSDPKIGNCAGSNVATGVCRSLLPSQALASVFYEHDVQGLAGTNFTSYALPTAAYLQGTTKIDISALPDASYHTSISDGVQTATFQYAGVLQRRTVPSSWLTWSAPPYAESATPDVLHSTSTLFTAITFSTPAAAVGFELEGNFVGLTEFLVEYYDDTYTLLGTVRRSVEGSAGARLFSFSTDWSRKISRVDISAMNAEFAIAQVRYSLTPLSDADAVTPIAIDIKPGTAPNDVQRSSKGKLPVAVLTTSTFNAADLDVSSVRLGDEAGQDTPVALQNKKTPMASFKDVDLDGDLDLILQFEVPALVTNGDLTMSTTQLVLTATRTGGGSVRGVDNVVVKP